MIDGDALSAINEHIAEMERRARLIARTPETSRILNGTFVRPVAFEINRISDLKREVFGPVLHVVRFEAGGISTLIDDINALGFGLTMGVHSRIDETMHAIIARARIGNIYVNRNQIGAVVGVQPFGGEGLSGTGPKAGGPHYLPALQKPRIPSGGAIAVSANAAAPLFDQQLKKTETAFLAWSLESDRREIFARAAAHASEIDADIFRLATSLYAEHFGDALELPGPTGESNTLRLKGRGVVVCLGGGLPAANRRQVALALAAGNAVICPSGLGDRLAAVLVKMGAPAHLVSGAAFDISVHEAYLLDPRVRAVAFDGDAESRGALLRALARREGSIAPLLSSLDRPDRFASERCLTINTTAAGGDVRLLSLPD